MSVAFRRESDEEHKEPTFEIPIAPGPNLVTERGRRLMEERLAALDAAIASADEAATAPLKREQRYWQTRRMTAVVVPPPPGDEVAFGSRVTIRTGAGERTVTIVGADEADPATDRVGFQAPLARALIGAGVGDRVAFGGVEAAIEVLAVGPGADAAA